VSVCSRVVTVATGASAVLDCEGTCVVTGRTITQRGVAVLLSRAAIGAAVRSVLPGQLAVYPSRTAGERGQPTVLTGVLTVCGGRLPRQHEPPSTRLPGGRLPGGRGGCWPVSLLSSTVPHLSGGIAPQAGLVPPGRGVVSSLPPPIATSSGLVALRGLDVSLPAHVVALFSHPIAAQRLRIALLGSPVPPAALRLRRLSPLVARGAWGHQLRQLLGYGQPTYVVVVLGHAAPSFARSIAEFRRAVPFLGLLEQTGHVW